MSSFHLAYNKRMKFQKGFVKNKDYKTYYEVYGELNENTIPLIILHGGGSFSGKDPSKVDRSAAYMCRYVAKNLVAAGVADRLEIQVAYAIGKAEPLSINLSTFKTAHYKDDDIYEIINKVFDFRPGVIIQTLDLKEHKTFNYEDLAHYGHFGRPDLDLP